MIRRRLFNFAIVVSLLVGVAALALWVRSYSKVDDAWYSARDQLLFIDSMPGTLVVGWDSDPAHYPGFAWDVTDAHGFESTQQYSFAGFGITYKSEYGLTLRHISVPDWNIVLVNAGLLFFFLKRRGRKFARNCCRQCGYNLTGNASGVCPECGTPVPKMPEVVA